MRKFVNLLNFGNFGKMTSQEVVKRLKDRADTADQIINKLKAQLASIRQSAIKEACRKEEEKLAAENAKLRTQVDSLVQKLIIVETRNGVKQIPIPNRTTSTAPPSQETAPPVKEEVTPQPIAKKEVKNEETAKKKKAPKAPAKSADDDKPIDISRLNIKVGLILKAEKHPDADSLYVETVDVGEERNRTIISGLVKHIPIEEMQNRKALFMCNLKPAKMRGILSEGMIMCASTPEKCEIIDIPADSVPGERAICEAYPGEPDEMLNPKRKIWEQVAPDFKIDGNQFATYKGDKLVLPGRGIPKAPTLKNVQVK